MKTPSFIINNLGRIIVTVISICAGGFMLYHLIYLTTVHSNIRPITEAYNNDMKAGKVPEGMTTSAQKVAWVLENHKDLHFTSSPKSLADNMHDSLGELRTNCD